MKNLKTNTDTHQFAQMVANKQKWKLNSDTEFLNLLVDGLTTNYNRYGWYLCPCRDTGGSREKDRDIICPCTYAPPDIAEYGHCYCGLYLSEAFSSQKIPPKAIPERRP